MQSSHESKFQDRQEFLYCQEPPESSVILSVDAASLTTASTPTPTRLWKPPALVRWRRNRNYAATREMNISEKLAHDALELIAEINRTSPTDGQETAPASSLDAMPVETLAALNHAGWMKLLME